MNWTEHTLNAAIDTAPGGVLEGRDSRGGRVVLSRPTWAEVCILHRDRMHNVKGGQAAEYCNAWGFTADNPLRVPQTPTTGLGAVIGKWPGGETDEQIADGLKSTEGGK